MARGYRCLSRRLRKALLLGEGDRNRKEWLENRLEERAEMFAVAVGGFALMDKNLHVLVRLDREVSQGWSDLVVVQTWGVPGRFRSSPASLTTICQQAFIFLDMCVINIVNTGDASIYVVVNLGASKANDFKPLRF